MMHWIYKKTSMQIKIFDALTSAKSRAKIWPVKCMQCVRPMPVFLLLLIYSDMCGPYFLIQYF